MPLQQIEKILIANRARQFYTLKETFKQLQQAQYSIAVAVFPTFDDNLVTFWRTSPTRHGIQACFLENFWLREAIYCNRMSLTSLSHNSPWLSCDHTFKSVRNIGTVRQADQHWIKQYAGLFCVMNGDGQVLSWKMTKTLAFEDIEDKLLALQCRLHSRGEQVQQFYVDNCCLLRSKLQNVFGPQLHVYLDLFHAVQRITKQIPKRHPYYAECLKSIQLVFRDKSDRGPVRTMATPSPHILRQQLIEFETTWERITYNGRAVISPATKKEIRCLMVHIDNGCLSGIPRGCGTNRNERLHKDINSHMTNSRYGVELGYALLTSLFFTHNERISAGIEQRFPAPIVAYSEYSTEGEVERFGFASVSPGSENPHETQASISKVEMVKLEYKEVQQTLNNWEIENLNEEQLLGSANTELEFTIDEAVYVMRQAVSAFYVSIALHRMSENVDFSPRNLFFTSFMAIIEGLRERYQSELQSDQIESLLTSWNLKRIAVAGDGNCLFTSIAFGLVQRIQSGDNVATEILCGLGVPESNIQDINYIQNLLRVRMVDEWNANPDNYQGFVTTDITTLTHEYLQSGHYSGSMHGRSDGTNSSQCLANTYSYSHLHSKYAPTVYHANNRHVINTTNFSSIHT